MFERYRILLVDVAGRFEAVPPRKVPSILAYVYVITRLEVVGFRISQNIPGRKLVSVLAGRVIKLSDESPIIYVILRFVVFSVNELVWRSKICDKSRYKYRVRMSPDTSKV